MNQPKQPIWTKDFLSISLVHFIVFVIFYTLLTTLPLYVINELGGSESKGGLVVTAMFITAIIIRPFSGKILEQGGKKNILLVTVVVFTISTFGYIWVDAFVPLILLRIFHGLSFGILTTATSAIAADVVPDARRGEGLGYFTMSMNLAVVAGPFLGLTLTQFVSYQFLFVLLSCIMAAGTLSALLVRPKEVPKASAGERSKMKVQDLIEKRALPIAAVSSLVAFSYSGVISFISVYAEELGLASVSSYFFLVFAVTMLLSRPYLGRLFDARGPRIVIIPCLFIFAAGLGLLSFSESTVSFLISAGLIGIGYGTLLPSLLSLSVQAASPERNSYATATFFMMFDLGIAAGSFLLGIVVTYTGFSMLFAGSAVFVILLCGLFHFMLEKKKSSAAKRWMQQGAESSSR
ncbi:MFS transporter [Salibacterium qingdaonense]|uniref:Predicted arabinose efflux permease, MFS family n=1 Tax=Salibacterium qingdaonense TaxID=266892 RepID=A0A1I4IR23_9BACI|nr:MFS transporter [Salibacterium qingdaonense]SFL56818.1 Predicted arabinose efflux permease, MFS family [Salibacterium qingdaonense]